jgi:hypothetical protein
MLARAANDGRRGSHWVWHPVIVPGAPHQQIVCWPSAGFSVWYQASDSWVGLVAFGVPIVVMTAALHAGVRIRYLPEVSGRCHAVSW